LLLFYHGDVIWDISKGESFRKHKKFLNINFGK
jgi:hypothetical protein